VVVFSLPEIDPDWTDNVVLLATSRNGEPLDASHGPLHVVVPVKNDIPAGLSKSPG